MDYWIGMAVFTLIFGYYAIKYFRRSTRDQVDE
jgi:ABC-type multidrug transport system permease subunit